jgi:DNA polymerase-3 subunit gamma/tau
MSEVLYRKYRPKRFEDVVGQEHVVRVLQGAIEAKSPSHAYLFYGSRGTGKTSIARIFAKAIGTNDEDIYEIDAASNTSVDNIRDLNESVNTLPFSSEYKVYILDEVHMLSKSAFNAFLKTLEEPPKHAIFILATTELDKVPETILSRCQVFTFAKPSEQVLRKVVEDTAKKEGFELEEGVSELLALLGDGSFRDTYGMLQKVMGTAGHTEIVNGFRSKIMTITLDNAEAVTGAPRRQLVNNFISAVASKNVAAGLATISQALGQNIQIKIFLKLALQKLRYALLMRYAKDMVAGIREEIGETDFAFLEKISQDQSANISSQVLLELLDAYEETNRSYIPELPLELALIKMAA